MKGMLYYIIIYYIIIYYIIIYYIIGDITVNIIGTDATPTTGDENSTTKDVGYKIHTPLVQPNHLIGVVCIV